MAKKHKHEDHVNHEAWAIPYGDLITLLLAFFVVMYAVSSVNEGKYRAASASLNAAFTGQPRTIMPVQIGNLPVQSSGQNMDMDLLPPPDRGPGSPDPSAPANAGEVSLGLQEMALEIQEALADLIATDMVLVRVNPFSLEVEIKTDILFASGAATLAPSAQEVIEQLGKTLSRFPNHIKVEGHTDNVPISTAAFPSNWELSAARAATVVHLMMRSGVPARQLMVVGLGEQRPIASNDSAEGRNQNRRVLLVILAAGGEREIIQLLPPDLSS